MTDITEELQQEINEGLSAQIKKIVVRTLLARAGDLTLDNLGQVESMGRYGETAKGITLQELIDAYVANNDLAPRPKVSTGAVETKKKAGRRGPRLAPPRTAGTEGATPKASAAEATAINFRDPATKEEYKQRVSDLIEERAGDAVSSTEIVSECSGTANQVRDILKELVADGAIVFTGRARATRYFWKADASDEVLDAYQQLKAE